MGFANSHACPIQHILAELMSMDQFFYALHDFPQVVERLAEQIEPYYQAIKACAAGSPAEVILLGSNYDDSLTYPAFFRRSSDILVGERAGGSYRDPRPSLQRNPTL